MAGCSTMKPSVHRKSAIGKRPGWAVHQSDFVRQTTGEGDQLILARHDVAVILGWHISVLPSGVVDSQFSSAEFLWLAVEEIHKCDLPLQVRHGKRFMAKSRENAREACLHACRQRRSVRSNIQQNT